jgi:hypothetical protein
MLLVVHPLQISPVGADPREESRRSDRGSNQVAIAYQPVTAPAPISTRPAPARRPYRVVPYRMVAADRPARLWTAVRIVTLVAATALCVALATAVVAGAALFALLNFAG